MEKIIFESIKFELGSLEQRIKIWEQIRRIHLNFEPFKFYKNKYKKWKQQLLKYDNIILSLYNQRLIAYDEYYEFVSKSLIINKNK